MFGNMANLQNAGVLISIVIPAHNGERTVTSTVSSVVEQRHKPLALVLIDDGSTDSTISLVQDFLRKIKFSGEFNLVRHEENLGLSKSLNDGISSARGDYVLILHQDCEFVGTNWVEKALSFMNDEKVAVVTGYYGISDFADENFIKRAFGILRKQFHSRPAVSCEEVTFSEGKCDLYRKDLLIKVGGFPTDYRIAGEDLIVSYKLRSLGYKIIKCYDLPVIQRFSGAAETFWGNLGKEFLFGKVMGGVFSEFKLFLFRDVKNSGYGGSRSIHRATQPIFIFALFLSVIFSFLSTWLFIVTIGLLIGRYLYYIQKIFRELKGYANPIKGFKKELLTIGLIGILTDFAYSFGFGYGLLRQRLGKRL
jgi:GT2 family glycosyltransferase